MKSILTTIFLSLILSTASGQDSAWKKITVNEILTIDLPAITDTIENGHYHGYNAIANGYYYQFLYYDSLIGTKDAQSFRIAITGAVHGFFQNFDSTKTKYELLDVNLGNSRGVMATLTIMDTAAPYKTVCYYVTIANDRFYMFTSACESWDSDDQKMATLFKSIRFEGDKVRENKYPLTAILLR